MSDYEPMTDTEYTAWLAKDKAGFPGEFDPSTASAAGGNGSPSDKQKPRSKGIKAERAAEGPPAALVSSWTPVNLEAIIEGGIEDPLPSILTRSDGKALFYAGRVHVVAGEPESGKGWLVLRAAGDEIAEGHHVLYVDFEDTAEAIVSRLMALGIPVDRLLEFFHYVRPNEPLGSIPPASIWPGATLVIIDSTTEALETFGLTIESTTDQAKFLKTLARPLADAGAGVVLIDHVIKDRDRRGRWAIGSQHKVAGTDVTYLLDSKMPFGRGLTGISRLIVSKDRPGHIRAASISGKHAGEVRMQSSAETGAVTVEIIPGVAAADFRPTVLMERISRYLEGREDQPTRSEILGGVSGDQNHKGKALECLIQEGFVGFEPGPRKSHRHFSIQGFRDGE